jgi:radical SAM/Cys-rich protein
MSGLTLLKQGSPLSDPAAQLALLYPKTGTKHFTTALAEEGLASLRAGEIAVLQVNVGKVCNQTCRHCHVDAGPSRREVMSRETINDCLRFLEHGAVRVLDITGGAPEMNPNFRWLVASARQLGCHVIDRCNLTILTVLGFEDLAEFLADNRVEIVASLPCYLAKNTDAQRGDGVFQKSMTGLRRLNALGYGHSDSGLVLNLVYNPLGPSLPPPQERLEADYRCELAAQHGIVFNRLYTITNMPISRFLDDLVAHGNLDQYMEQLIGSYNPAAVAGLMCRSTLSVGWDGRLFDCDFNQMLELGVDAACPNNIKHARVEDLVDRPIVVGQHCFGCTAGSGSSCQGAIVPLDAPAQSRDKA